VLCSLLWVTLLGQGVGLGDPRGPFQPLPFCDSAGAHLHLSSHLCCPWRQSYAVSRHLYWVRQGKPGTGGGRLPPSDTAAPAAAHSRP